MAPLLIDDLDLFLEDFAVPVTANGTSGSGILDQNSEVVIGGEVVMIDYLLTVKTAEFGALSYGDLITVDGASFRVEHEPLRDGDGRTAQVPLVWVSGTVPAGYSLTDDLLSDFGVTVTIGGTTGLGILDKDSEIVLGGQAVKIAYTLTGLTSFVGSLEYGDTLSADGVTYRVEHEPMRIDDGGYCKVPLMPAVVVALAPRELQTTRGARLQTTRGALIFAYQTD
jgi:hypothetical protein